jgi:hypothetical protein
VNGYASLRERDRDSPGPDPQLQRATVTGELGEENISSSGSSYLAATDSPK